MYGFKHVRIDYRRKKNNSLREAYTYLSYLEQGGIACGVEVVDH